MEHIDSDVEQEIVLEWKPMESHPQTPWYPLNFFPKEQICIFTP